MVKITKKDKNEFNQTDNGNTFNNQKNFGVMMLSVALLLVILFGLVIDTSEAVESIVMIVLLILAVFGSFFIGNYYGQLYRYIESKKK